MLAWGAGEVGETVVVGAGAFGVERAFDVRGWSLIIWLFGLFDRTVALGMRPDISGDV